jgi:class 3 adenylate cyclase/tetratricopeptide (TPR) repeat protein
MSLFSSYIPLDRRLALAERRDLPHQTRGAVLFADIAGFGPLTKALTHEMGPQRGVEELSLVINRVYEALIAEVHRYGGAVFAFGGDAITCWFDENEAEGLRTTTDSLAVSRAVTCALAMQEAMRPHTTIVTPTNLTLSISLKISIAVGSARRFILGDPAVQHLDTLAGTTLKRMAIAETMAQQGEILLDEGGAAALADQLTIQSWREGQGYRFALITDFASPIRPITLPTLPVLPDEVVRPWLLTPVYERLKRGENEFLTELRMAVAMFVAFDGLDYDEDEEAGHKLDIFIRWVQRVLTRYEGYLIDLSMGDKGSHLYIVFGALQAHENDPVRAVAAAWELQNPPAECGFVQDIRIGISRGRMRCGVTGASSYRTYGVHGNEVNVAAYLMTLAKPRQILVTERIVSAPGQRLTFQPAGEVYVKRDPTPLSIFVPIVSGPFGPMNTPGKIAASPLVGREQERSLMQSILRQLGQNAEARYAVFIEGDAGIGKSCFLHEIINDAEALALQPLLGEANAIEKSTPYYAWRMVFTQLLRQMAPRDVVPDTPLTWRQHVLDQLTAAAPFAAQLAPLINPILALDFPENDMTRTLNGEVRANNTRWMLVALLQQIVQQRPLVLLFEDGHWLDSASWALLLAVHQVVQPLLTVMTLRPLTGLPPDEYTLLRHQPNAYYLPLTVLDQAQIEDMVCQRLGVRALPAVIAQIIHSRAEGHPFFSEELAYTLQETGLLLIENGECYLAPQAEAQLQRMKFPDTIEEVITSRIDLLPPQQQLALKVGSAIGRAFAYRTLHDIHPVEADKSSLKMHLTGLEKINVLAGEHLESDSSYLFKHVLIQEVAYNLMTFSQRRQLHEQIATWYEQIHADDQSPYYPLLAHHWIRAENTPKALDNLERAGELAFKNFANEEAITFFSQALALDTQTGYRVSSARRARWELLVGEAYVHRSRYGEGQAHLEAGVALLGYPVGSRGRAPFNLLRETAIQVAHRYLPTVFMGRKREHHDRLTAAVRAYNRLTEVYYFQGESALCTYTCIRATNLGELAGSSADLAEAYGVVAAAAGIAYLFGPADRYAKRALSTARQIGTAQAQAGPLMVVGAHYQNMGHLAESEQLLHQLIELATTMGDYRRHLDGLHWLGRTYFQQGNYALASQIADELYAMALRRNESRFQALALYIKAFCLLHTGRTNEALSVLHDIQQLIAETGIIEMPLQREMLGLLILAYLRQGEMVLALPYAEELVELTTSIETHSFSNLAVAHAVELYLTLWEQENRRMPVLLKKGMANLRFFARSYLVGQPRLWLHQGWLAWLQGKEKRAHRYWQKALYWAEKNGMMYECGRVHAEIARHLPPDSPARADHWQKAHTIFTQINAHYDQQQLTQP